VQIRRRLAQMTPAHLGLLCESWAILITIRVALWLLPWRLTRVVIRSFPIFVPTDATADSLERAVLGAARRVPCATCLSQALALQQLLCRGGYESHIQIGVAKRVDGLVAHAWVEHDGKPFLSVTSQVASYSRLPPTEL
jgi:Transglutaminase-like superfamily